jgi:large subunit ribosomal protein L21
LQLNPKRLEEAGPDDVPCTGIEHEGRTMFAVIKTGGKQYRVAAEDMLRVEKIPGEPGEIVQFGDVLVVGGDSVTLGAPTVNGASVAAEVIEQGRGAKVIAFKKRRRKNSRRKRGHRQEFTLVRITEILTDGAKPTKTAKPKAERKPKPAETQAAADDTDDQPETKAKSGKKPAAKAKSAKKPARKTAAKTAKTKSKK